MSTDIGQQMQQLYSQFGELPGITIELHKELLAISVDNEQAFATVFLQGAQLSHYQRKGEAPLIWCSDACDYQSGQSLRGGIPICWPWFGGLDFNPQQVQQQIPNTDTDEPPAHGFVRNRLWQLEEINIINPGKTQLTLSLSLAKNQETFWPYPCDLRLVMTIAEQLTVKFEVHNRSDQPVSFSSALHSYFHVESLEQVSITGLDQLSYVDCLDNWQEKQQQGPVTIDREVDRIYRGTQQAVTIHDGQQRAISLQSQGSNSAIVWNPWIDKAKRLSNFPDHSYQQMLCIETANAEQDFINLAANAKHSLDVVISVKK